MSSIVDYLSELGLSGRIGDSHAKCKCGATALWIPNENFAMCFACRWRPSVSLDYSRAWLVVYMDGFFGSCRSTLLGKGDERHGSFWAYFAERGIAKPVVMSNDIGMMSEFDLTEYYEAAVKQIDHEAEVAEKALRLKGRSKKNAEPEYFRDSEMMKLSELHESVEKLQDSFRGSIAFFAHNAEGKFIRARFRKPFESHEYAFASTKNVCGSGLFGGYTSYPLNTYEFERSSVLKPLASTLLVTEGEFNHLSIQQKLYDLAEKLGIHPKETAKWLWSCALGSSSDADCRAVAKLAHFRPDTLIKLCYDWDTAGLSVCEKLRAATPSSAFCIPSPPTEHNGRLTKTSDLDAFLRGIDDPEKAMSALAEIACKARSIPKSPALIADEVREIRKDKELDELDTRTEIKDYLWTLLCDEGDVFTDRTYAYAFNRNTSETWRLDNGSKSAYIFSELFGLPSGEMQKSVMRDLGLKILHEGERADVHSFSFYDRAHFTCYINLSHGAVAKITPDSYHLVQNGADGVFFYDSDEAEAIPKQVMECIPNVDHLRCGFDIDEGLLSVALRGVYNSTERISQGSYEMLFLAKYLSLFLPQLFTRKNIVFVSGPSGGGKTFLSSKPGWLLRGSMFRPAVLLESKKDQLETMLTNESFIVIDNFDSGSKPNQALLCQACTTGTVPMRALYETNRLVTFPIVAEVFMTGLSLPNFKGDLNNRILEFPFLAYEEDGKTETQRQEEFLVLRVPLLGETFARIQLLLRAERAETEAKQVYRTCFRIKDFGLFCLRQAHFGGFDDEMGRVLNSLVEAQEKHTEEKSSVFPMMSLVVGNYLEEYGPERMNATRLCSLLTHMASALQTKFHYEENPIGLGMFINENRALLNKRFGLEVKESGGHTVYRFQPTEEQVRSARAELKLFGISDRCEDWGL